MRTAAIPKNRDGELIDGKFPLLQSLGGSEHSAVFLTELRGQESRKAAIKLVHADIATMETQLARWQTTAGLSQPHLVRLFHAGQCEIEGAPLLYVVTEYAEENLSQVIPSRPLTAAEMGEMLPPLIDALSYLHERRLLHGQIKPSNIMAVDNQLKLSSDTILSPEELGASATEPSMFDAPELATGTILPASDVWSLGVTIVTALTQHPPAWEAGSEKLILPDTIPTALRAIARACLRRDPAERCTLEQIKVLLRPPPPVTVKRIEQPERRAVRVRPKRNASAPIIGGIIVLAVLAGIGLVSRRTQPTPTEPARTEPARPTPKTGAETKPGAGTASPASGASQGQDTVKSPPPEPSGPPATPKTSGGAVAPGAVAEKALPDVATSARKTITGTVRVNVRVSVGPDGKVLSSNLDSPSPSRYFGNLALQAARNWRFKPPQLNGNSVASEWILRFQFTRSDTQVVPLEVSP
jgi:TonB family protein